MNRFFLVPALGAAALALATQAQAGQIGSVVESAHPSYSDEARQPYYESRRAAYDNGYREGLKEGERDGRNRSVRRYEDNRTWQRGDKGYNRSFGDVERYRQQFRVGFTEGYQAGYARYGQVAGRYESGRAIPRPGPSGYPGGYGNSYPDRNRYPAAGYVMRALISIPQSLLPGAGLRLRRLCLQRGLLERRERRRREGT